MPLDETYPKCLLYCETKHVFFVKSLRFNKGAKKGRFRDAFGKDQEPPFLFTRVVDNAFTGSIQLKPGCANNPVFTADTAPHTILTEKDLDDIFSKPSTTIKMSVENKASICTKVTEREYVNTIAFNRVFLNAIKTELINKLCLKTHPQGIVPSKLDALFVGFDSVNYHAGTDKYPQGPSAVILRHKIIKHVLEDTCPFIKVALFDSLGMEKALAMCLPTGSFRKGTEIFLPKKQCPDVCYKVSSDVIYDGGDFRILTDEEASKKNTIKEILTPLPINYFKWVSDDDSDNSKEYVAADYKDFDKQLALLSSVCVPGETSEYFHKATVVYSTHSSRDQFACLDFINFYARVASEFGLDNYITQVLKRMTAYREQYPAMKSWIVTLLGKARWADSFFYNRMKALSVAVVVSTISANAQMVTGSSTDGLMIKPEMIREFVYPAGFPVKKEFVPRGPMMSNGPLIYVGVCGLTGKIVHRGLVGRKTHPGWYYLLIGELLRGCLGLVNKNAALAAVKTVLLKMAGTTHQYLLPDTHRTPVAVSDKRSGTEFFINDLCAGICQMYAIIDDHVIPSESFGGHAPPLTQAAWLIKQINVNKYLEEIKDKIYRTADLFKETPDAVRLCQLVAEETAIHIEKTLPKTRAMYPGGVDYV